MKRLIIGFLVFLFLIWGAYAQAAMTLGASSVFHAGSGTSDTFAYAGTTSGRGMWCGFLYKETSAVSISSATIGSDTFTLVGTPAKQTTTTWYSQIGYVSAMSGSGSQTVTINLSSSTSATFTYCQELYDSVTNAIALDGTPGNAQNNTANPTVNVTTLSNNSAVFAVMENDGASAPTAGSGYTLTTEAWFLNESWEYYLNIGTAGTYAANVTLGASNWTLAAAAFTASGGVGPPLFGFQHRRIQ